MNLLSKTPQELQQQWENDKLLKYNVLNRFHRDLQRDPTKYTRFYHYPQKESRISLDTPHAGLPYTELTVSVVASIAFGAVFGFIGWAIATGNTPNHHVLDHLKPTTSQQFKHQGRFLMEKVRAGKVWAQIGIVFTFCDWLLFHKYKKDDIHYQSLISSFIAGGLLGIRRGPQAALFGGLTFTAFTGVFALLMDHIPDFMPDQYADIDARIPPGAPPDWKPYREQIPLMPRDSRIVYRDEMRREKELQMMEQQRMQMQQMGMGGPGGSGPPGASGPPPGGFANAI